MAFRKKQTLEERRDEIEKQLDYLDLIHKNLVLEYAAIQRKLLGQAYHFQNSHEHT